MSLWASWAVDRMGGTGWAWFQLTDLVDTLGDPFARNPSSCENQDYLAPRWCDVRSVFHLGCLGVLRSLDHHSFERYVTDMTDGPYY